MRRTALALTALLALALAACGGSNPAAPPSAASLARRMGCQVTGPGQHIASQYTDQDLSVTGSAPCQSDEVYTFRSQANETKWLSAYSAYGSSQNSCVYMITGPLWAVDLTGNADGIISDTQVQQRIGGKPWTGGC